MSLAKSCSCTLLFLKMSTLTQNRITMKWIDDDEPMQYSPIKIEIKEPIARALFPVVNIELLRASACIRCGSHTHTHHQESSDKSTPMKKKKKKKKKATSTCCVLLPCW